MPPLSVLIKPVSSSCNMNCSYCFYMDVSARRQIKNYGRMTLETLEKVISRIFEYAEGSCSIAWQGGEPTLAGLPFFRTYLEMEKAYNTKKIPVFRAIQTNGYQINREWAAFLAENHFLTGLSLDGIQTTHDFFRKSQQGTPTFSNILSAAQLFNQYQVEYNVLTVVNSLTAGNIRDIYSFYQSQGFHFQQYIACLDPLGEKEGRQPWSLLPEQYGNFLIQLFDLWYEDCMRHRAPYIRQFENYLDLMLGMLPEACEQCGTCGQQTVIEADGSVFPCDFYVTDEYFLGNIREHSLKELQNSPIQTLFLEQSFKVPSQCRSCPFYRLCRNGCRRHRTGKDGINYFCESYKAFFSHALSRMEALTRQLTSGYFFSK